MTGIPMTRVGTISLCNANGVSCRVVYFYDLAQDDFRVQPSERFTQADIDRAMRTTPNMIKAIILCDIQSTVRERSPQQCMPCPSAAADSPVCGLSGGR